MPELRREELAVRQMIDEAVRLVSESPIGFGDKRLLAAARSLGKQAAYWKTASSHGDFRWSKQSRQRAAELEGAAGRYLETFGRDAVSFP